jgi:phosphoglycolate phosphatase
MRVKGAIFDLDGTLVHTIDDIAGAVNSMLQMHGFPTHGTDSYLKWVGSGAAKLVERALPGSVAERELMQYVNEFKEFYGNHLHDKSRIYEGIPEVLDEMVRNHIRISILSNKPHLLTRQVTAYYLDGWPFDPVLGQRDRVPRKPDPAAALEIAEFMGLEPREIFFIGDSENDILTANSAGMIAVGVGWGYGGLANKEEKNRFTLVSEPAQLLELVK